ncbi:MAG TPA: hypothetical protein VM890_05245 [Longimicrobium sp.]|nr:hypothetical protein [Longimicrobium sp.]
MTPSLRSALLVLAAFCTCTSAAAQGGGRADPVGAGLQPGGRPAVEAVGGVDGPAAPLLGPRRAPSFRSAPRLAEENGLASTRSSSRATTTGAVIGGVLGAAVGAAFGYSIDNIERSGSRPGSATIAGAAGGAVAGALLGAGIGWLAGR